jgi:hypothetical protein
MPDLDELINYYKKLCNALNCNGFKIKPYDMDYVFDNDKPESAIFSITQDMEAYNYLKNQGLIRSDLCHFCGEHPINNAFYYTEPNNNIKINICEECHGKGKRIQSIYQAEKKPNSGCLIVVASFAIIIISTYLLIRD